MVAGEEEMSCTHQYIRIVFLSVPEACTLRPNRIECVMCGTKWTLDEWDKYAKQADNQFDIEQRQAIADWMKSAKLPERKR